MTLGNAIQQVWEAIGEPDDLSPAKTGVSKLREALNDAADAVAMWIDDRGRKVFFHELEDRLDFSTVVVTGTLDSGLTDWQIIDLPIAVAQADGRFTGWVMQVGNETRRVVSSTDVGVNRLALGSAFSTDPSAQDFTLVKVNYQFSGDWDVVDTGGMRIAEVVGILDPEGMVELERAASADFLWANSVGDPTMWRRLNTGILLDAAPETSKTYQIRVVRYPTRLSEQVESFDLPEAFCQAVVLRGIWWGFRRMQDFNAAYATKRDFQELMTRLATASWLDTEPDYFTVRSR